MTKIARYWLILSCILLALGVSTAAWAQDDGGLDFTGGGEGDSGGDGGDDGGGLDFSGGSGGGDSGGGDGGGLDFSGGTGTPSGPALPDIDQSKTQVIGIFYPVDKTRVDIVDGLQSAMFRHMVKIPKYTKDNPSGKVEKYQPLDPLALRTQFDVLDEAERETCINDPQCVADTAKIFQADKVIIGRIRTEGLDRPKISLELIDVETAALENAFEFEADRSPYRQKQELKSAVLKLLNIEITIVVKTGCPGCRCNEDQTCNDPGLECTELEESSVPLCVPPPPGMPTGQLVAAISTGAVGLGFIGAGIFFGLDAQSQSDDVATQQQNGTISQRDAQSELDDAGGKALIANVFYGIGAAAVVASVVLFVIRIEDEEASGGGGGDEGGDSPPEDEAAMIEEIFVQPSFGTDGAGFVGGFRF